MTPHSDCSQTDKFNSIGSTLERLEEGNARMITVMEKIAEQGATLRSLQGAAERHEKSLENIFKRLGNIEVKTEGEKVKVGAIMAGISAGVALITAVVTKLLIP